MLASLESGEFDVLSLDVFDTLVWRSVAEPVDVFPLLGWQLQHQSVLRHGLDPDSFAVLRKAAESRARSRRTDPPVPEVNLEEIYEEFAHLFAGRTAAELALLEVDFERSIITPDLQVVALARAAQGLGLRIVLVSDTYFTEAQLRSIIDRPSTADLQYEVFASCAHRRGKGHGLFGIVSTLLGVDPARMLHLGDHPHSDVAAPKLAGIEGVLYHKFPGDLARVLDREVGVREGHIYRSKIRPHSEFGDMGLTALRAKTGAMVPAAVEAEPDLVPYWQFGASVLGPLFGSFAAWVLQRTAFYGADTVHCMMREGEFLARAINQSATDQDVSITAEPLWISRRVCAEAVVEYASRDELNGFLARRRPPTVAQFVAALGIPLEAVAVGEARRDQRMDDREVAAAVVNAIVDDSVAQHAIIAASALRRRRLVDHLRRSLSDSGPNVLVDLGWGATIQTMMHRAFAIEGIDLDAVGLYLVTTDSATDRVLDGHRAEGFLGSLGHPETIGRWVTRSPEALEQVCMSDGGSLIGFEDSGKTIHATVDPEARQHKQRRAVQDGAVAFQRLWNDYRPELPKRMRNLDKAPTDYLRSLLLRFVVEPMPGEAGLFSSWLHDENFGSDRSEGMMASELAAMAAHMTPTQFLALPMTRVYWPFGMAALSNPPLALAAATVAADIAPAGAFASSHTIPITVETDAGGGYIPAPSTDCNINVNGLSFLRTEFLQATRSIRIFFGDAPGILRLDAARVVCQLQDGSTYERHLADPEAFAAFQVDRGFRLATNLVYGLNAAPVLTFAIPLDRPTSFRVELEIGFALLQTPNVKARSELASEVVTKAARSARRKLDRLRHR